MIIWIDGPIHAGKTTVARRLVALRPRTVHIEIDDLRHFADCLALAECIPFCIDDAAGLTRNWIGRGFDVVLSWPVMRGDMERFVAQVGQPVRVFTLLPRKEVTLGRRGERVLTERERRRVEEMYVSGMFAMPVGEIIDNSEEGVDVTVERILRLLG